MFKKLNFSFLVAFLCGVAFSTYAQEDIEGSIANVEPVIGVPTSRKDCKNRSQFIQ